MRRFFSIGRNQVPVLVTLMIVILLGAVYLFVYIPDNETEIKEQRFRTLQRVDKNIHSKIDNSVSLMNQLLMSYTDSALRPFTSRPGIDSFIRPSEERLFTLSAIKADPDTSKKIGNKRKKLTFINAEPSDSSLNAIKVNEALKQFKLYASIRFNDSLFHMSMLYKFDQFLKGLLPGSVFDEYMVFSKGNTVYETFPAGLSYQSKDSLLNTKNKVAGSSIREETVGGVNYKMFLQPVGFDSTSEWIVAGLLKDSRFQQEKKQLPAHLVLILVIVAIVGIISLPWLKLFKMGNRDRLTLADGSWSFLVGMLLMSMLFFILLWGNTACCKDETKASQKSLADKIGNAFLREIEDDYKLLRLYDSTIAANPSLQKDIRQLGTDNMQVGYSSPEALKKIPLLPTPNLKINQAFWLDSATGLEIYNWTKLDRNAPHGIYKDREYFKKIINHDNFFMNGNPETPYYIEQVISWTYGNFRSVISLPSKITGTVAAISVNLKSLDNIVMPVDCQFAVTNENGDVLYHSDKSRNLNENLIEEFSEKDKLISSYKAHSEGGFATNYYQKSYDVYITPLKGLPYFLLILSDKEYIATRNVEIFGFTLSMLLLFISFPLMELLAILMVLISTKNFSFKNKTFATQWLWPKKSGHAGYVISSLFNGTIILLLICFYKAASFAEYFFMLLLAVTLVTICFNCFITTQFSGKGSRHSGNKRKIIACMCFFVLAICIAALNVLEQFWTPYFIFFMIAVSLLLASIYLQKPIIKALKKIVSKTGLPWSYINSYSLMAVTRFIITSGIPVILFYNSSFNYQQSLLARHKHIEFANKVSTTDTSGGIYTDTTWISGYKTTATPDSEQKYNGEQQTTIDLFKSFHFYKNDIGNYEKNLNENFSTDGIYSFRNMFTKKDTGYILSYIKIPTGQTLELYSSPLLYNSLWGDSHNHLSFWILFFIGLTLFFFIIRSVIKKMFALNLPELKIWDELDTSILTTEHLNQRIFIIGAPGSKKLEWLKENKQLIFDSDTCAKESCKNTADIASNALVVDLIHIFAAKEKEEDSAKNEKVCLLDLTLVAGIKEKEAKSNKWKMLKNEAINGRHEYIIIDHFSYNIHDAEANREKLNFLENIRLANKKGIFILSTTDPCAFRYSLYEAQNNTSNLTTEHDQRMLVEALSHFSIITLPLKKEAIINRNDPEWKFRINREIRNGHFLNRLSEPLTKIAEMFSETEKNFNSDTLALKIQLTSQHFYNHIWNTLTNEEKFILYDLAEDGLVNVCDTINVQMLIAKGLIQRKEGVLEIFNKGFRNFVVSSIGRTESIKIQRQIRDSGNWNKLKTPLLLILFAILALLLVSQQEAYSKVITYLTALGGGITALLRITSMFDRNQQKTG